MDDQALRTCICETGRELLENGLVARTWGNVSARADGLRGPVHLPFARSHSAISSGAMLL